MLTQMPSVLRIVSDCHSADNTYVIKDGIVQKYLQRFELEVTQDEIIPKCNMKFALIPPHLDKEPIKTNEDVNELSKKWNNCFRLECTGLSTGTFLYLNDKIIGMVQQIYILLEVEKDPIINFEVVMMDNDTVKLDENKRVIVRKMKLQDFPQYNWKVAVEAGL